MKSFNIFLAFIFVSLMLGACSSVQEANNSKINMQERPDNITAKMSISIQSEEMNIGGNALVMIAGEDSLFMNIFGPFGINVGKLYADKDNFYFYNAMEGTVLKGEPTAENIRKATFLNISAVEIINLFKNIPPTDLNDFTEKAKIESGTLYQHNNEFMVINNIAQMVQYQRKDEGNVMELNITYSDFNQYEKYSMPSSFEINAPVAKSKVSVSIKEMSFPKGFAKEFKFAVPKNARVIEL